MDSRFWLQGTKAANERLQRIKEDGGRDGLSVILPGMLKLCYLKSYNFALRNCLSRPLQIG